MGFTAAVIHKGRILVSLLPVVLTVCVCVCRGVCELKLHSAFPLRPSCVSRGNVILLFYLARNVGDHAEPLIESLDPPLGLNLVRDANLRNIRDVVT